jgi:ABC-2 type transport system permease protein
MLPALKSETRKLLTVRSTYFITLFSVLLVFLIGGFGMAYKQDVRSFASPGYLENNVASMLSLVTIFCGIVALVQFSHEYRYNTIMYTLTSSNSRHKILLAKIITLSLFAIGFTLLMGVLEIVATKIGVNATGHAMAAQSMPYGKLLWHGLFTGWGYAMLGLLLVALVRNQVFAVVTYLLIPMMIEPLLGQLLKENAKYLPYSAMNAVLVRHQELSDTRASLVFMAYLVVGWVIAWLLFLRRDAN